VTGELGRLFAGHRADRSGLAPLGDLTGDVLERFATLVGEAEGDVRLTDFVGFLLRVGDVGSREGRVVFERVPAGVLDPLDHLPVRVGGCSETTTVPAGTFLTRPLCDRF